MMGGRKLEIGVFDPNGPSRCGNGRSTRTMSTTSTTSDRMAAGREAHRAAFVRWSAGDDSTATSTMRPPPPRGLSEPRRRSIRAAPSPALQGLGSSARTGQAPAVRNGRASDRAPGTDTPTPRRVGGDARRRDIRKTGGSEWRHPAVAASAIGVTPGKSASPPPSDKRMPGYHRLLGLAAR
jgi:hypothetical protein